MFAFLSHIYDEQDTDSTGARTKGKAHCYYIKAIMKVQRSDMHGRK